MVNTTKIREAGRNVDTEVAEKVMGLGPLEFDYPCDVWDDDGHWRVPDTRDEGESQGCRYREPIYRITHKNGWRQGKVVPRYSTDIAAAWTVLEKMRQPVPGVHRWAVTVSAEENGWFVTIWREFSAKYHRVFAPTAPHAICLAVLKAVDWSNGLNPPPLPSDERNTLLRHLKQARESIDRIAAAFSVRLP